jgi:hypothetical protein
MYDCVKFHWLYCTHFIGCLKLIVLIMNSISKMPCVKAIGTKVVVPFMRAPLRTSFGGAFTLTSKIRSTSVCYRRGR